MVLMNFSEKAKEILKKIINEYQKRSKWNKKSLREMVDKYLKEYNEEVREEIEEELKKRLGSFYFINDNPQIAVTPVSLSEMLYKNAKEISKLVTKILYESIKAKETIREIALKIYEGYDFKEEFLKAREVLPKYLLEALKRRDKEIMKQIEKLKTKPLRIAYKEIIRKMDILTDEELQKLLYTAYHEKMRYYAARIAKTETHRAFMSQRAKNMLEDEHVEFVKFEMSPAHPKTDICDFYASLDVGYGRGIIPKKEMRTLPLHPHCYCVYTPYYKKVKGKRKSWKRAVKETMNRFSEKEQREILGSYEKLMRFKAGEDIEKIFNSLRPKYPIRKYIDLFGFNFKMESYKKDLIKFIDEIKSKNIKRNEVIVGEFEREITEFLKTKGIESNQEIFLSVRRYFHIIRDFKKSKNKAVPENIIKNFPFYLANPIKVYFDNHPKHKNLVFIFEYEKRLYKIIVNPSGEIVTAGNVNIGNFKEDIFEEIKR